MASHATNVLVIVGIDGSLHSENALKFYLEKLHQPAYTVGLLHSYEKPNITIHTEPGAIQKLNIDDIEKQFRTAWDAADKIIAKYKKICNDHGVEKVEEFLEHGKKPGEAICNVAERENAAVIVLGNRGLSLVRRTFLGSVSDYVINHSKEAAVLLVPLTQQVKQ